MFGSAVHVLPGKACLNLHRYVCRPVFLQKAMASRHVAVTSVFVGFSRSRDHRQVWHRSGRDVLKGAAKVGQDPCTAMVTKTTPRNRYLTTSHKWWLDNVMDSTSWNPPNMGLSSVSCPHGCCVCFLFLFNNNMVHSPKHDFKYRI